MIKDYVQYSVKNISNRRMRSWLTMIGIFIGIAAVVSLVSLGQGLQQAVLDQFMGLGADKIIIQPKGVGLGSIGTNPTQLTDTDLKKIRSIPSIKEVAGEMYKVTTIEYNNKQVVYFVFSLPRDTRQREVITQLQDSTIEVGRALKPDEKGKVVVGYRYNHDKVFDKNLKLGDKLIVNGKEFEIAGFMEKIGSEYDDTAVYMNEDDYTTLFSIDTKSYDYIYAQVEDNVEPKQVVPTIERELRKSRNLDKGNEDFEVQTFDELLQSYLTIFGIIQAVVVGIAAISLLVGGIGIMNTMYTSVLERTKEIGVMKAIGAKNSDILTIFIIESGILGFVGGLIGIIIGAGISKTVEFIGTQVIGSALLKAAFPMWLIFGALAFSTIVGILSGLLPAKQASSLKPVDALRYE